MTTIELLEQKIRDANRSYWNESKSNISDIEYDKLVQQLKKLDPANKLLTEIGSEQNIGADVVHVAPMLSLSKAYSYSEVLDWAKSIARSDNEEFLVSCKYDGLSVEVYKDRVSTRGDGYVGKDITALSGHITVVHKIEWNAESERFDNDRFGLVPILDHNEDNETPLHGELIIPIKKFAELKERYPEVFSEYKTPRNLASGFAMSKPGSVIYDLNNNGRPVFIAEIVNHKAYEIRQTLRDLKNKSRDLMKELRDFNGYPSDGICFFVADKKYFDSLGATAHHPRGAIAWKFTDEQVQTVVKNISWQVGEQHITPVCEFDPVPIGGVLVQRATAHCAEWLKEHMICVGSRITIERRGGVIPKVVNVENDDPNVTVVIPKNCPECGKKLDQEGKFLVCTNKNCVGKCVNRIVRGFEILGLKGVGPALASKVVHELLIDDIIEWCEQLGSRSDAVISLLRAKGLKDGEISTIVRLSDIIDAGATPEVILQSVCIPNCGPEFTTTVEKECGGIQHLLGFAECDAMYGEIVDRCKLNSVTNFMIWMEQNKERFMSYMNMFKILPGIHANTGLNGLKGQICFTGSGQYPRNVLSQYATGRGYGVTDNVSKCTILVAEDKNGNSSKLQKARKKGIRIISYDEFSHL